MNDIEQWAQDAFVAGVLAGRTDSTERRVRLLATARRLTMDLAKRGVDCPDAPPETVAAVVDGWSARLQADRGFICEVLEAAGNRAAAEFLQQIWRQRRHARRVAASRAGYRDPRADAVADGIAAAATKGRNLSGISRALYQRIARRMQRELPRGIAGSSSAEVLGWVRHLAPREQRNRYVIRDLLRAAGNPRVGDEVTGAWQHHLSPMVGAVPEHLSELYPWLSGLAVSSAKTYGRYLERLRLHAGRFPWDASAAEVEAFLASLPPASRATAQADLRAGLNRGVKEGYIKSHNVR